MNNFSIQPNINCFYIPDLTSDLINLPEEESRHAVKSLRMRMNDNLLLTNGNGTMAEAIIVEINSKGTIIKVSQRYQLPKPMYELHIVLSPLQHADRLEWFIEKAVEMGVQQITPVICQRTENKKINMERLSKISIAALKQSRQAYLPVINPVTSFADFIKNNTFVNKGICVCMGHRSTLKQWLDTSTENRFVVLIGPEGDFTQEEIELALSYQYAPLSLGNSTLRSETAALFVASGIKINFLQQ